MFRTLSGVSFCKNNLYGLKGGCHNIFKAVNLLTNWLKISKLVNVTDFPIEQLFKYLVYLAEMCCDSKGMKFWSMDVPGRDPIVLLRAWWVSLALSHSLFILHHSSCGFPYNHLCCPPTTPLQVRFSFCDGW